MFQTVNVKKGIKMKTGTTYLVRYASRRLRPLLVALAALLLLTGAARPLWADTTVGVITVGSTKDWGYNEAQAVAGKSLKQIPGVKVVVQDNVPETIAVTQTMQSMINFDNAKVIFATSYGYFPFVCKLAPKYPKVLFVHCGGDYIPGKTPKNVATYFGDVDEVEYLSGIVAGYSSKSGKLGFIAAKPIPQVLRDINAFTLGARSVNPKATCTVVFTGDWFQPVKEAQAVNSLADQGIDVVTMHVDSPKQIILTAKSRGIYVCGYHFDGAALYPKGFLTGSAWNWAPIYKELVTDAMTGKTYPHSIMEGFRDGVVKLDPFGPAVSPAAKAAALAVKKEFMAGKFQIFKGPLYSNGGKLVIPAGVVYHDAAPTLDGMNYLVKGVIGKISWN